MLQLQILHASYRLKGCCRTTLPSPADFNIHSLIWHMAPSFTSRFEYTLSHLTYGLQWFQEITDSHPMLLLLSVFGITIWHSLREAFDVIKFVHLDHKPYHVMYLNASAADFKCLIYIKRMLQILQATVISRNYRFTSNVVAVISIWHHNMTFTEGSFWCHQFCAPWPQTLSCDIFKCFSCRF